MFAIFNYAIIVYSWWILRETQGKSLEEMENVFGSIETAYDVEAVRAQAKARWEGKNEGLGREVEGEGRNEEPAKGFEVEEREGGAIL